MNKIIKLKPSEDFQLYIEFSDGLNGEINFSQMLKSEEYKKLNDLTEFKKVSIDEKTKDIIWECGVTMCKNATRNMLELMQKVKNLKLPLNI
jgi:predicted metalloprotease with PDZ domain